jgi:hypothetical protein
MSCWWSSILCRIGMTRPGARGSGTRPSSAYSAPATTESYPAVPIVHDDGSGGGGLSDSWEAVAAVRVGDQYVCWTAGSTTSPAVFSFLVCDMADKTTMSLPKLRYVRLPAAPTNDDDDDRLPL